MRQESWNSPRPQMLNPHPVIPLSPPHSIPGWDPPSFLRSPLRPGRPWHTRDGRHSVIPGPRDPHLLPSWGCLGSLIHPQTAPQTLGPPRCGHAAPHTGPPPGGRQGQSGRGRQHRTHQVQEQRPQQPAPQASLRHPSAGQGSEGSGARPRGQPETAQAWLLGMHSACLGSSCTETGGAHKAASPSGTAWPDSSGTNGAEPCTSHGSRLVNDPPSLALLPLSHSLDEPR